MGMNDVLEAAGYGGKRSVIRQTGRKPLESDNRYQILGRR